MAAAKTRPRARAGLGRRGDTARASSRRTAARELGIASFETSSREYATPAKITKETVHDFCSNTSSARGNERQPTGGSQGYHQTHVWCPFPLSHINHKSCAFAKHHPGKKHLVLVSSTLSTSLDYRYFGYHPKEQEGAVRPIRTGLCKDNMTVLYAAPSWRHSARAEVRLSLKLSREYR